MKGKDGTGDPGGPDAMSRPYSPGSGLCPSREKRFFADVNDSGRNTVTGAPGEILGVAKDLMLQYTVYVNPLLHLVA